MLTDIAQRLGKQRQFRIKREVDARWMTQPHQRRSINCRPRSTLFPITLRCLCYCKMQIIRTENREREGREGREEKGTPEPILFLEGVITLARPGAKRKKKVCLQSDYKGEILKVYDGATSFLIVTDLFFLSFFSPSLSILLVRLLACLLTLFFSFLTYEKFGEHFVGATLCRHGAKT